MPSREEKVKAVAQAFMRDDPKEYAGESLESVIAQLSQTADSFIEHAYQWFVLGSEVSSDDVSAAQSEKEMKAVEAAIKKLEPKILSEKCITGCGSQVDVVGAFVPDDQALVKAPPGMLRIVPYGVCIHCMKDPTKRDVAELAMIEQIEARAVDVPFDNNPNSALN